MSLSMPLIGKDHFVGVPDIRRSPAPSMGEDLGHPRIVASADGPARR